MAGDDKLNRKIKDTFYNFKQKAPANVWDGISSAIDKQNMGSNTESQYSNDNLISKIKQAYSNYRYITPEIVWYNINKQLNLDDVWFNINEELDKRPAIDISSLYKIVAAITFILLIPLTLNDQVYKSDYLVIQPVAESNSVAEINKEVSHEKNIYAETDDKYIQKNNRIGITYDNNKYKITQGSNNKKSDNNIAYQEGNANYQSFAYLEPLYHELTVSSIGIKNVSRSASEFVDEEESQPVVIPGLKKRPIGNRFSFGPSFSYNNTWLINNETRKAKEKGSLISTSNTFRENVGVALFYRVNQSGFIASDFQFVSRAGQQYHMFLNGNYEELNLELNYSKTYLFYQQNFLTSNKSILSNITLRLGGYGAILVQKNGEIRSTETNYSNNDFGLYGALGQEKKLGNFVLSFGISADKGLKNIFMGNEIIPARFNKTYNVNFGTYLQFRYQF